MTEITGERLDDTLDRAHEALAAYRAVDVKEDIGFDAVQIGQWRAVVEVAADRLGAEELHALAGMCIEEAVGSDQAREYRVDLFKRARTYLTRVADDPRASTARRLRAELEISGLTAYRGALGDQYGATWAEDHFIDGTSRLTDKIIAEGLAADCPVVVDTMTAAGLIMDRTSAGQVAILPPARIADHPEGWHVLWYDARPKSNTSMKLRVAAPGPSPFIVVPPWTFNGGGPSGSLGALRVLRECHKYETGDPHKAQSSREVSTYFSQLVAAMRNQRDHQRAPNTQKTIERPVYDQHIEWYLSHTDEQLRLDDDSVEARLIDLGTLHEAGELAPHDTYMYGWMQLELARASGLPADFEQAGIILQAAEERYREAGEISYAYEARLARLSVPLYEVVHTGMDMPTIAAAIERQALALGDLASDVLNNRRRTLTDHPEQAAHFDMLLQQITAQLLLASETEHYYFMIPSPPRMTDRHALTYYWDGTDFTPTSNVPTYFEMTGAHRPSEVGRIVITPSTLDQADGEKKFATLRALRMKIQPKGNPDKKRDRKITILWNRVDALIKKPPNYKHRRLVAQATTIVQYIVCKRGCLMGWRGRAMSSKL